MMMLPLTFSSRPVRLAAAFGLALAVMAGPAPAEVALIEAPEGAGTQIPEGAFSLVPERHDPAPGAAPGQGRVGLVGDPPVVIELFTSQGCSSCPPADALVASLAEQPGVLTLSWHVDYWDYLGWTDEFGRPEHTARQEAYAAVAGERGVYTPQIIVDGQDTVLSLHRAALMALIDEHHARPPVVMVTATEAGDGHVIDLTPRAPIPGGVEVTMVRYLPHRTVLVKAGENRGRSIGYSNIVVGIEPVTLWPAREPLRLTVRAGEDPNDAYPDDTRHAILVQQALAGGLPGPILAAVQLD
jgi:hypothetical protein